MHPRAELHVTRRGTGPTIICLHGFTHDGTSFDALAQALPEFEVVAPDLPGHDRTQPGPRVEVDFETATELLHDLVATDVAGPVDLLGYSMGGRLALHLALGAPEIVRSLILVSASPTTPIGRRASKPILHSPTGSRAPARRVRRRVGGDADVSGLRTLPEADRRRIRRMRMRQNASGLAAALRGLSVARQPNHWPDLEKLTITGGRDTRFTEIARRMQLTCAYSAPHAAANTHTHVTLDGVGHLLHLEAPDRAAVAICRFLRA